jgi:phage terminase large subunit-like protein
MLTRNAQNEQYQTWIQAAKKQSITAYKELLAELGRRDLFFLLTFLLNRRDVNNDWLYARCREVQAEPDGMLDLWAREHYKSTIITFALTIQDILNDPELTFGIFSVKRELAQDFLKQIKEEFENNTLLQELYPDILYTKPDKESPCWGLDKGIRVKRQSNSREETIEAWGLIGGMPTGKHFKVLVYDDVVTEKSVTNHDQLSKAYDAVRLSFSLGSQKTNYRRRMIGTRYHLNDAWGALLKAKTAKERIYPATEDGTPDGRAVFMSQDILVDKRRDQGPYIFACQMLQNPRADEAQGFSKEWIRAWTPKHEFYDKMNIYLLVDPASARKIKNTGNDYTVMWVIGLAPDNRYYLIDGLRDRLNLTQRTQKLFAFVRQYKPIVVGYEEYGMQADIEHIEYVQDEQNFHFSIVALGGKMPKNDRIRMLIPIFENFRFYTPGVLTIRDTAESFRNIIKEWEDEEFLAFPVCQHDDMLDCMARILDPKLQATFPDPDEYVELRGGYPNVSGDQNVSNGVDYDPLSF